MTRASPVLGFFLGGTNLGPKEEGLPCGESFFFWSYSAFLYAEARRL
jgi:hypothetical protein